MGFFHKLFDKKRSVETTNTSMSIDTKTDDAQEVYIKCNKCNGVYEVRSGKYGMFAGCTNYPDCQSTLSIPKLVLEYINKYGINIYRWEKECYKCKNKTYVYSYYLSYELEELDEVFSTTSPNVGLGDLQYVDEILSQQISTIQICYSKTIKSSYMANTCQHCGALQGRNYVVDDPHEIIGELWHNHSMKKYFFKNIKVEDISLLNKDIEYLYNLDE